MIFCSNCGNEAADGSKFCNVCGKALIVPAKTEPTVTVLRCPSCGAIINSFTGKCKSCGCEFSGLEASRSIKEFTQKLAAMGTTEQRINLIKSFPIPNTKEDIMEYMILASSNIGYHEDINARREQADYEEAWLTKFIQAYQKAKLVFEHDNDFPKIQTMYENALSRRENIEKEHKIKLLKDFILKNIGTTLGIAILLAAFIMDITGANSSLVELAGIITLIISANTTLRKQDTGLSDFLLAAGSGAFSVILSVNSDFPVYETLVLWKKLIYQRLDQSAEYFFAIVFPIPSRPG